MNDVTLTVCVGGTVLFLVCILVLIAGREYLKYWGD